jgi:uncharacterized protein (DUF2252 family)
MTQFQEDMVREAVGLCSLVKEKGIMDTQSLKSLRRLMNVYEGKPIEGKYHESNQGT